MHIDVNGLVLCASDRRENDKYLTVLTDKLGKIRVTAKGANKKGGGICASCQLFSYSKMTLFENRGYYQLDCAQPIFQFYGISNNIESLALCSYFCQAADTFTDEGIDSCEILRLCLCAFYATTGGKFDIRSTKAAFELRLMSLCGYKPQLTRCNICEKAAKDAFFDIKHGAVYCADCRAKAERRGICMPITDGALDAMRYCVDADIAKIFSFRIGEQSMQSLCSVCEAYLINKSECGFKTLDFYKSLGFMQEDIKKMASSAQKNN